MKQLLPKHSKIKLIKKKDCTEIVIPYPDANFLVYLLGVIAFVSIFVWWFGLMEGFFYLQNDISVIGLLFYFIWLFTGVLMIVAFIRGSRPPISEKIIMGPNAWSFFVGVPPFPPILDAKLSQPIKWKDSFSYKQKFHVLTNDEIRTLRVIQQNDNFGLLINCENSSQLIADWLSEEEKKWLFIKLKEGHKTKNKSIVLFTLKEAST